MFAWITAALPTITRVSSLAIKVAGIAATGFGIRQIWHNANEQQTWQEKALLSTLYAFHIGSVSLTTVVLLGVTDVTAPVATAIVCSTALLKNVADLLVEKSTCQHLEKQHSELALQHSVNDKEFTLHLMLLDDRKETVALIDHLTHKIVENQNLLKSINKIRFFKYQENLELLSKTRTLFNERNAIFLKKSKLIETFFAGVNVTAFDAQIAIKELLAKAMQLRELRNQNPQDDSLEQQLSNSSIIQLQCIRYNKWQKVLTEIDQRLLALTSVEEKVEQNYLQRCKNELQAKLINLRAGIFDLPESHLVQFSANKRPLYLKKDLQKYIKAEIDLLQKSVREQKLLLAEKDSHLSESVDLLPLANQMKALTTTRNQLFLTRLSEKVKAKNVDFGVVSATVALTLAVAPDPLLFKALNPMMLIIGGVAGVVSMLDLFKKYQATHKITLKQSQSVKKFVVQKKFQIAKINSDSLRSSVNNQLNTFLVEQAAPDVEQIAVEALKVALPRKVNLHAKQRFDTRRKSPKKPDLRMTNLHPATRIGL